MRNLAELANLINVEFTKEGDQEVLSGLRKQIVSSSRQDNEAAFNTIKARGINITKEEFEIIRDYTVFEAGHKAKAMKRAGYTYIIIGAATAVMSLYLKNKIGALGLTAAAALLFTGYRLIKKAKS